MTERADSAETTARRSVRLAITMGDPAGIGPEIVRKTLLALDPSELSALDLRFYGSEAVFRAAHLHTIPELSLVAVSDFDPDRDPLASASARSGAAAAQALLAAIDAANERQVDGIVTAPLSKEGLKLAGYSWPGQTECLIERSGSERAVMLFVGGGLRVALATRHVALRDVVGRLDPHALESDIAILDHSLRHEFGIDRPRIGLCGVNPHAGEHGLFGDEESRILTPVVARLRVRGIDISDPLPADTLFVKQRRGAFDAAFAMYHDQGLIPVKLLAFGGGVNVSIGLPFIRTSPDHGTAYDIAGRGVADPGSFLEALRLAAEIAWRRRFAGLERARLRDAGRE